MAIVTMILGKSGTGKSAAMRNLKPEGVALIQCLKKPLPFKSKDWAPFVCDDWKIISAVAKKATAGHRKIVIIDDFQYMMANEYMRRTNERGFEKFTEIGLHAWQLLVDLAQLPDDVRVYVLSHVDESESGQIKIKTIGKMLDEKITLEGMVTIVLRTHIDGDKFCFATQNNGSDTTKSPMGLFESRMIDNDLAMVDKSICDYYEITQPEKSE